jgi:tripartite-type tricarboxylate transporter receptor subunit TctC
MQYGCAVAGSMRSNVAGKTRWRVALVLLAAAAGSSVVAQGYPVKPVRVVIGFAAGSSSDVTMRILGPKLTEIWGQSVVVDNRPGAGGNIAAEFVANAPPDGYTLLFPSASIAIAQSYYRKLPYNALQDFAPVTLASAMPNLLCVNPSLPVKSVQELIALAKSRPGEVMYSSSGTGSSDHMATELFSYMSGIRMTHIPYKGGPQALSDVISGEIAMIITGLPAALPQVKAGKVRAVAVTTAKRTAVAPEIPTVAEAGVAGYEHTLWNGMFAPVRTPAALVTKVSEDLARAVRLPDVKERFAALGIEPVGNSPQQFDRFFRAEVEKWAKVVKATGIQGD